MEEWKQFWDKKLIGTHRSYHRRSKYSKSFRWLDYEYGPISHQLSNGIRDIQLDLHWNPFTRRIEIYNHWFDRGSYYSSFKDALKEITEWSCAEMNNDHWPIVVSITPRGMLNFLDRIEDNILEHIPRNKIYIKLSSHNQELIWSEKRPRNKIIFLLMDEGIYRECYLENDGHRRVLMTLAFRDEPLKKNDKNVFIYYDNPIKDFDKINQAHDLGYIVKTDINRPNNKLDFNRAIKACKSKAHILVTNYPFIFANDSEFIGKVLNVWGHWPMVYESES